MGEFSESGREQEILWGELRKQILEILKRSRLPQSLEHALGTQRWAKKIKPNVGLAFDIATLGHDIEACVEKERVRRDDYTSRHEFKGAHAQNSARVLVGMMKQLGMDSELCIKVEHLVTHHEIAVDPDTEVMMRADSISFFENDLPLYFKQKGEARTKEKILFMYNRLAEEDRGIVKQLIKHYKKNLSKYEGLSEDDWQRLLILFSLCVESE